MDDDRVATLIRELDAEVPRDDAVVRLVQYGGGPDESKVVANRFGYLRLGIEFLRGANAAAAQDRPVLVPVDLDYLTDRNSNIVFDLFEYDEALTRESTRGIGPKTHRLIGWALGLLLLTVLGLAGIGAIAVVRWIAR